MALKELKSNLSWYGKESPGPYKTNANVTDTKFKGADDIPYVESSGYEFQGISALSPISRFAGDSFIVDDITFSSKGIASRKAQLGTGTSFPGGEHKFDITRTGFNVDSKYGDIYGVKFGNAGLADTYTINSPIDDMYNKFNLRDDATPNSYIKHPLNLRGIQRKGSSDPQRYGIDLGPGVGGAFDIPRGGIVTAASRLVIDVARHAKFLASPKGIGFLAKQFGYQLMNPKKETRIYNPLSLGSIAPTVHINRHAGASGLLGGIVDTVVEGLSGDGKPSFHEQLRDELFSTFDSTNESKVSIKGKINLLSSNIGGPGSILGIGGTSIRRYEDTSLKTQLEGTTSGVLTALGNLFEDGSSSEPIEMHRYSYENAYQKNRDASSLKTIQDIDDNEDKKSIKKSDKFTNKDFTGGGKSNTADDSGQENTGKRYYKTNTYQQIKTTSTDREPDTSTINDYRLHESEPVDYDKTEEGNLLVKKTTESIPIVPHIDTKRHGKEFDGGGLNTSIEGYKSLAYPNLKRDGFAMKKSFSKNEDYDNTNSLMVKYGVTSYGADPIQKIEPLTDYDPETAKDLIKFKFTPLRLTDTQKDTELPIIFRAFLGSVADSFQPSWDEKPDQGRADAKIMMNGWARNISLDFIVPVMSKAELNPVWGKLDELAKLTYPIYASSGFTGTYVKVTIGDLYNGIPMYIQSLDYDWDNETPWELDSGQQVPLYTNVSMTLGWIGIQRPDYNVPVFSYQPTDSGESSVAPGTITYGDI